MRRAEPVVVVWAVLVAATFVTWALGADHPVARDAARAAAAVALVIAFGKAWLVGRWFMDVRNAAPALRALLSVWAVGFCAACVVLVVW